MQAFYERLKPQTDESKPDYQIPTVPKKKRRLDKVSSPVSQKVCQYCHLDDTKVQLLNKVNHIDANMNKENVIKLYCEMFPDSGVAKNLAGKDFILYETFFHRDCLRTMFQDLKNQQRKVMQYIKATNPPRDEYEPLFEIIDKEVIQKKACVLLTAVLKKINAKMELPSQRHLVTNKIKKLEDASSRIEEGLNHPYQGSN